MVTNIIDDIIHYDDDDDGNVCVIDDDGIIDIRYDDILLTTLILP